MATVRVPSAAGGCPAAVAGDKGYSYGRIRFRLACRGVAAVIPARGDRVGRRGRPPRLDRAAYLVRSRFPGP